MPIPDRRGQTDRWMNIMAIHSMNALHAKTICLPDFRLSPQLRCYHFGYHFTFWKQIAAVLEFLPASILAISSSSSELWCHSDFQDGGRQPCWICFAVMLGHKWSVIDGPCFDMKFGSDQIYIFGDNAIFILWHFGLKLLILASFGGFGACFPKWCHPWC